MAQDFTDLATTEAYAAVLGRISDRDVALALAFDPAYTTPTNVKTRTVRWNSANAYWEYYNGSAWAALASTYNITAAKANNVVGGAAGGLLYQSAADTTAKLALGTTNYVLTAGASGPQWVAQSTLSAGSCSGNAATATNATQLGGVAAANYATLTGTETLANKRITQSVVAHATATSITPACDTTDIAHMTNTQAVGAFTANNPTGTPTDGQTLILRLKCTNVQTFSWGSSYRGSTDQALPTVTTGSSKTDYLGFKYNSTDSKWDILSVVSGF